MAILPGGFSYQRKYSTMMEDSFSQQTINHMEEKKVTLTLPIQVCVKKEDAGLYAMYAGLFEEFLQNKADGVFLAEDKLASTLKALKKTENGVRIAHCIVHRKRGE